MRALIVMAVGLLLHPVMANAQTNGYVSTRTEKGLFAPIGQGVGFSYIHEPYRVKNDYESDPYSLNGAGMDAFLSFRLYKKISIEMPIGIYYTWMKDTERLDCNSLKKYESGMQLGVMFGTAYRFNRNSHAALSFGPKFNMTIYDAQTKHYDNARYHREFTSGSWSQKVNGVKSAGDGDATHNFIDIPLSIKLSYQYKGVGMYVNYDYGLINRLNSDYYKESGDPKSYKRYNDYLRVGLMFYIGQEEKKTK